MQTKLPSNIGSDAVDSTTQESNLLTEALDTTLSRRTAIKIIAGGTSLLLAPQFLSPLGASKWGATEAFASTADDFLAKFGPIDRTLGDVAEAKFFGDSPDGAHAILWDKDGYLQKNGGLPEPSEEVPLVIIGGGISGLTSAYLLREHKPIVLEQAARFGGNAKGMGWKGVDFSLGAAYFIEPEEDSDLGKLCVELGLDKGWRVKEGEDPVVVNGRIFSEFWSGITAGEKEGEKKDEAAKPSQFETLLKYFQAVNEGEEIPYPDIPITDPEQNEYINTLDKVSFLDHLKEKVGGGPLHPHIEAAIEHYCWSSFGGSASEISAACGMNFYASEFGNLVVFPGGNSGAAEIILKKLSEALPKENLRPSSLVFDVRVDGDQTRVTYVGSDGKMHAIRAKAVVMACPKFVVGRVLDGIEPERLDAIRKLRYRSYLVANILLNIDSPDPQYDLYMLGQGNHSAAEARKNATEQGATDVIVATFAKPNAGPYTVLTLYRGFPFDGARPELLSPTSYDKYRNEFVAQYEKEVIPLLHTAKLKPVDVRVARWGHPLPLAAVGLIADGTLEKVRAPFKDRVFFVEQDNWALPAFETAVTEAMTWAAEVEKKLS